MILVKEALHGLFTASEFEPQRVHSGLFMILFSVPMKLSVEVLKKEVDVKRTEIPRTCKNCSPGIYHYALQHAAIKKI